MAGISRRRFLTGAAAVGAAGAVGANVSPADAVTKKRVRDAAARTGTVADVKHVVIVMQENRSFDHYYGSLGGVHGFSDTTALTYQGGSSIFSQPYSSHVNKVLLPWHMDTTTMDAQDAGDLDHSWSGTHGAFNGGLWNKWVSTKSAQTMGYFTRADLPWHYSLADAFTICDQYHCSIQGPTTPNRLFHWTGTIDPAGVAGGPAIDNPADYNPVYSWTTYPERLQAAGVSWQVFANDEVGDGSDGWVGDYGDNPLWLFHAYHNALTSSDPATQQLAARANVTASWKADSGQGTSVDHVLSQFITACASGNLPTVSWVVAPYRWCEHPAARPVDGSVYVQRVLKALWDNEDLWESTAVLLNYDENDGYFDHITPPFPAPGTPSEFVGGLPVGLGPRVPMTVVSPWSRGGYVDSQVFDHTSVIRFLEVVTGVQEPNISAWRRAVCGDLTSCFDFTSFDPSIPTLPDTAALQTKANGQKSLPGASAPTTAQTQPVQEATTRTPRPLPYHPEATVAVNRSTGAVTASMTTAGTVAMSFLTYPNIKLTAGATPTLVMPGGTGSYVWDASKTDGVYDFTVYGPDGFLRRFAGSVVPAGQKDIGIPSVTSAPVAGSSPVLNITLGNAGRTEVRYRLTSGIAGVTAQSVYVESTSQTVVPWATDANGRYDVTIQANTGTGFVYRLAGRISAA